MILINRSLKSVMVAFILWTITCIPRETVVIALICLFLVFIRFIIERMAFNLLINETNP